MLSPQMVAQVVVVLNARLRADRAYREVMAITHDTPMEEMLRLEEVHTRMVTVLQMEERQLLTMTINTAKLAHPDVVKVGAR